MATFDQVREEIVSELALGMSASGVWVWWHGSFCVTRTCQTRQFRGLDLVACPSPFAMKPIKDAR